MHQNVSMLVIILRLEIMHFPPFPYFPTFQEVDYISVFLKIALLKESSPRAMVYRWQGDWGLDWAEVNFGIVLSNMLATCLT